jgi:uncharacterized iron-regulated membrane protein
MAAGWINLIVLIAALLIFASAVSIFSIAAKRRGGREKALSVRPSKAHYRKATPETGDMLP